MVSEKAHEVQQPRDVNGASGRLGPHVCRKPRVLLLLCSSRRALVMIRETKGTSLGRTKSIVC